MEKIAYVLTRPKGELSFVTDALRPRVNLLKPFHCKTDRSRMMIDYICWQFVL